MKRLSILILVFFVIAVMAVLGNVVHRHVHLRSVKTEAADKTKPVIDAMARYQADHRNYPESLDGLVPQYLPSLPTMTPPVRLTYFPLQDHYELCISVGDTSDLWFNSKWNRWKMEDPL